MNKTNSLPCNVKFMIEGEEECGSSNLGPFCRNNKERLKADIVLISDTSVIANDCPSIDCGLRGLSYLEVEVTGPNRDLHSGVYGGAVANPINVLAKMIASLHDENNHITVGGFYDNVLELTAEERTALNLAPFSESDYWIATESGADTPVKVLRRYCLLKHLLKFPCAWFRTKHRKRLQRNSPITS
jgi:acetylornithine deacetylase/succinyl-diaminopimelate desuccinylase-like protein